MIWTSEIVLTAISLNHGVTTDCIREEFLVDLTKLTPTQVEQACLKLRKHGLLEKCDKGCHAVTDAGREAIAAGAKLRSGPKSWTAPKVNKNSLRIKVWRAMRLRQKFSIPDLAMLVAEGGEKDIASNIGKYVRALCKAGVVIKMPKREAGTSLNSNGHIRYWLTPEKNTGPQAPVWRVGKQTIYDPNTEMELPLCG